MQDCNAQQVAGQPDCKGAQLNFPAVTIFDVVQQAPSFLELLIPEGVKALTATCTQLRQDFRSSVTNIQMTNAQDTAMLCADKWPSLVMVIISTTVTLDEHQIGNYAKSHLSDRGWSTIVRLHCEQSPDDPTNWSSAVRQSVALIVNASHQSSADMDTKAHGSALARFATKWEAKARLMCMYQYSKSVRMDPLKHLYMGKWPCPESMICHGQHGNAPTVCWLWGDSSSNLQLATMIQCSLCADMIQSRVTTCPHLCNLSLTDCKIEAAALECLNKARFSRLDSLDLSINLLCWSGVRSLSSCHLPALQWLNIDDTNLNALAAMYLARGCWPNMKGLHLFDNQLNVEAVAYLVKGEWPLLEELNLSWTCVPEAAFEVLGVADACKQFESTQPSNAQCFEPIHLLRSSFLVWPELKALTVCNVLPV